MCEFKYYVSDVKLDRRRRVHKCFKLFRLESVVYRQYHCVPPSGYNMPLSAEKTSTAFRCLRSTGVQHVVYYVMIVKRAVLTETKVFLFQKQILVNFKNKYSIENYKPCIRSWRNDQKNLTAIVLVSINYGMKRFFISPEQFQKVDLPSSCSKTYKITCQKRARDATTATSYGGALGVGGGEIRFKFLPRHTVDSGGGGGGIGVGPDWAGGGNLTCRIHTAQ
ncbi:hypothetical protein AGLY_010605 [Aphis glycines]|uniref:Uncharacterized protein n=1 Tax=Aphis glycines TaxID=307491 RepID=A0A6G0TE10_APHGL|nr:hypothetical protein AGLY_010605 [Aphis glycines]